MATKGKSVNGALELAGTYEAAELIGVERSRIARWLKPLRDWADAGRRGDPPELKMPMPVAVLQCGPIWRRSDLEEFATSFKARRRARGRARAAA